jgi:hypothetical protein
MVTIRRFLLFSSLVLLAGCAYSQPGPGLGYGTAEYRYYRINILEIDRPNYHVKGEIVDQFFNKDGQCWESGQGSKSVSTFRVRDLEHVESQLKRGHTYNFGGLGDSIYLELYPDDATADKKECKK